MKLLFPGYFQKDDKEYKDLWATCLFIFDTNILLNLYRYSDETSESFLKTLDRLKDRVWIPHRVADEYLENRLKVIYDQQEEYIKTLAEVEALNKKLDHPRRHPFVSKQVMEKVRKSLDSLTKELENNRESHSNRMLDDSIKEKLSTIFLNRVGRALNDEELESIIIEGEKRYREKVPPGYSDTGKATGDTYLRARCRPYGDLIVWKAIIEKAKTEQIPVIFITDDGKEDWWLRFKGKTIGPRPELIDEFIMETGQSFHMYQPEKFLSLAGTLLKQETSEDILEEIREYREKTADFSNILYEDQINNIKIDQLKSTRTQKSVTYNDYERLTAEQLSLREKLAELSYLKQITIREALSIDRDTATIKEAQHYSELINKCDEYNLKINETQIKLKNILRMMSEALFRLKNESHIIDDNSINKLHHGIEGSFD